MDSPADVILMDLHRLGMSGHAAVSAIRELPEPASDAFIIAFGAHSHEVADEVIAAGADLCLEQPLDFDVLVSHLAERVPGQSASEES